MNLLYSLNIFLLTLTFIFPMRSSINGFVTDKKSGSPLIGANIMLLETNLGSASDENGYYNIENIPIGNYTLLAMFIGYENLEKEIKIDSDSTYTINLNLSPSSIKLQTTTVTAEKRKDKITGAPASIEIISNRDLKRETTTNLGSYLKGLKGVDFTSSGINNYNISIRGFNSSFNTRTLTLTDGRIASIPALRVINYSTVPQSMDDVERMEVILGPSTALYGANAHSGVVNIISKSPAQSEGLTMSISGSNDERQLRKINARIAKKVSQGLSIKVSGMYLQGYEWPYISETEYQSHLFPWIGDRYRMRDGKDNNPWNSNTDNLLFGVNIYGDTVRIGNGEANHDDLDGDGVAGEDWYNGYDDDGDGLIDEDYFTADGIDNNGDGVIDENIDHALDSSVDGYDNDSNGNIDDIYEDIWVTNLEQNIIIKNGRRLENINGEPNHWFIEGQNPMDLRGDYFYDEEEVKYIFDIYIYDFGVDNLPGDPYEDISGDGIFQLGEPLINGAFNQYLSDCGSDGICKYLTQPFDIDFDGIVDIEATLNPNWSEPDPDGTEGDGIWQPRDGWLDLDGDGIVNLNNDSYAFNSFNLPNENNFDDVWPPANGQWDPGEEIFDYGQDGLPNTNDLGEGDNLLIPIDLFEGDGIFDTGDKIYGFSGEPFIDCGVNSENLMICQGDPNWINSLGNGRWDEGEDFTDLNGDNIYTPPDYIDNFQVINDKNGDGINDFPDFEVKNYKVEIRLDYDPYKDLNLTFQSGYSWTKSQQVTGTSRYLADGFEYRYYQLRGRYKDWYSQVYMNQSYSGNTRSYNEGDIISDQSTNIAYQLQKSDLIPILNTKLVWGLDYIKTLPKTNGTVLNDGPNGYDNDYDQEILNYDEIDNDNDGLIDENTCTDGLVDGFLDGKPDEPGQKNGKFWKCGEGIDEPDEFINPESNEYGIYYQTKTELFGTSRFELITAARWDTHDLLDEGIQFAPKIGLIYKPSEKSSMRFTYGKAYNTPNSITLNTDLYVRKLATMDVFIRGNKNGSPYCRVGQPCSGSENVNAVLPGFYQDSVYIPLVPDNNGMSDDYFSGNNEILPYEERVNGAPYFKNLNESGIPNDMIPLDTSRYLIFIPELNGEGVLYNPLESFNIPDVEPIRTEKIQTIEFGYKNLFNTGTHITLDYYLSFYKDFFSPPTFITPAVVLREDPSQIVGVIPISGDYKAPFGTAWNGIDDDNDWNRWKNDFNWDNDRDGNCPENAEATHHCWADPGEFGYVYYETFGDTTSNYTIYHPEEVLLSNGNFKSNITTPNGQIIDENKFISVGVDEYIPGSGLAEAEQILTGLLNPNGEQVIGPGIYKSPPTLILSPMNYGDVWMQGIDAGFTQFLPNNKLIIDANISWYGTTEFYNKLTRKNDPINAPKWKWNMSIKKDSEIGNIALNYRHVEKFEWKDGIWSGIIGPYDIFDLHYNYRINKNLELNISALNFMDNYHKELIGGALIGRQIIMRLTSNF